MKLEQYLSELRPIAVIGNIEQEVSDIASDSRKATDGALLINSVFYNILQVICLSLLKIKDKLFSIYL